MAPVMPRMMELITNLALKSKDNDIDMKDLDSMIDFDIMNNDDDFFSNIDAYREESDNFLASTSKENQIAVAKVVKSVIEMNGVVTDDEQEALDDFCTKYGITNDELNGNSLDDMKKELNDLMHSILTTFASVSLLDKGNEALINENEESEDFFSKILIPALPRIMELAIGLMTSGASEEDLENLDFDIDPSNMKGLDLIKENLELHTEKSKLFLAATSRKNQIIVGKIVKSVIEMNGEITAEEQKAMDDFCAEYKIESNELENTEEESALFESILNN
jgi:uncharacterized tellurite resistance protein B-like protein